MAWIDVVVSADTHGPHHSEPAMTLWAAFMKIVKPKLFIHLGDALNLEFISRFVPSWNNQLSPTEEVEEGKKHLLFMADAAGKAEKVLLEGNHEKRLKNYIALMAPKLIGVGGESAVSIPHFYKTKSMGYKYIEAMNGPSARWDWSDRLVFLHGTLASSGVTNTAPANLMNKLGKCCIFGHGHRMGSARENKDGRVIFGQEVGCLCKPPSFLVNDQWTRGFVGMQVDTATGQFTPPYEIAITETQHKITRPGSIPGNTLYPDDTFVNLWSQHVRLQAYKHKDGSWKTREV